MDSISNGSFFIPYLLSSEEMFIFSSHSNASIGLSIYRFLQCIVFLLQELMKLNDEIVELKRLAEDEKSKFSSE